MHPAIARHRTGIAAICKRYRIRRLDVFGSAARGDDFDADRSDADFLVEFASDAVVGLDFFFGAKADLEKLLERRVDLVQSGAVLNPFILASINRNRECVYSDITTALPSGSTVVADAAGELSLTQKSTAERER